MFSHLKTYLQFGSRFCGIEYTSYNNQELLHSVTLKKTKTEAEIENCFKRQSVKELSEKLSKNQHAFLVINDSNILTKSIKSTQIDSVKLLNQAFPNIVLNDFYYEIIHQGNKHFIAIGRKTHIDSILEKFKKENINIIDLSLGNSAISKISEFINSDNITTHNSNIQIESNLITSIEKSTSEDLETYDINGLEIENNYLLSLSGALSSLLNNRESISSFETKKLALFNDYKQVHFFKQFLRVGLAFILGLLLANFLFFNSYFNKVNTLQQTAQMNQVTKSKVLELNESVQKVEKMVEDMQNSSSSKTSYYANAIVNSLPASVLLSELNYQPLAKRIKADQPLIIEKNKILVSGTSSESDSFSKWLSDLEKKEWVSKIDIIEYGSESNRLSDFSIKIIIINE